MQFDEDWLKEINRTKGTNAAELVITYENGFAGTGDFDKNKMTGWEVKSASGSKIEI